MDAELRAALVRCGTDIDEVMRRFSGDEALYVECLADFLDDRTAAELGDALLARSWDEAFTAAHALKGLAGNMGFIPLFHAAAQMVTLIRAGRTGEASDMYAELIRCYNAVINTIRKNCE